MCFAAKESCIALMTNSSNGDEVFLDLLGTGPLLLGAGRGTRRLGAELAFRDELEFADDAREGGVVDAIGEFAGILLDVEEFAAVPREVVQFVLRGADHKQWRSTNVAIVLREDFSAEVIFTVGELAGRVALALDERLLTAAGQFHRP